MIRPSLAHALALGSLLCGKQVAARDTSLRSLSTKRLEAVKRTPARSRNGASDLS
jgi:hypothetical protein